MRATTAFASAVALHLIVLLALDSCSVSAKYVRVLHDNHGEMESSKNASASDDDHDHHGTTASGPTSEAKANDTALLSACLQNPSAEPCSKLNYTGADSDFDQCADEMPFMIGINMHGLCHAKHIDEKYCPHESLILDVCLSDAGMGTMACCSNVAKLCTSGSVVPFCTENPKVPKLLNTMSTVADIKTACTGSSPASACSSFSCGSNGRCGDNTLSIIGSICTTGDDSAPYCQNWKEMCQANPSIFDTTICGKYSTFTANASAEDAGSTNAMPTTTAASTSGAYTDRATSRAAILALFTAIIVSIYL